MTVGENLGMQHRFNPRNAVFFELQNTGAGLGQRCFQLFGLLVANPVSLDQRRQALLPVIQFAAELKNLVILVLACANPGAPVVWAAILPFLI